ncbi:hypothetical protein SK128_014750 [Halocaridina rubra]|uniref:Uncharacterized protein n=1 Tax=Halocaridina rubra TaxID=373956 RepID=A0AAN8XGY7_HALRR
MGMINNNPPVRDLQRLNLLESRGETTIPWQKLLSDHLDRRKISFKSTIFLVSVSYLLMLYTENDSRVALCPENEPRVTLPH